jgi:predicted nucleic acid-binding protein
MAYLLDANVFIAAKNLHYGLDFCPAFWDWLAREHAAGKVFSVEQVAGELRAGDDELAEWVAGLPDSFSLKLDVSTASSLATVAQWVNAQTQYSLAAKNNFLQIADYYLVAQALAGGHTVVTHEIPQNSVHRVKIPNVCLGLNVPYLTPFEMLRRERARFVLERRP